MAKILAPGECYAGRAPGLQPINVTMPRDAVALLVQYAPSYRTKGVFLARLLYEHQARVEERERITEEQAAAAG